MKGLNAQNDSAQNDFLTGLSDLNLLNLLKQTKNNSHTKTLDQEVVVLKHARRILR